MIDHKRYRIEYSNTGNGVATFDITTPGVRVVLEYTNPVELITIVHNLEDILVDAAFAYQRGEVKHLPVREWNPIVPEEPR